MLVGLQNRILMPLYTSIPQVQSMSMAVQMSRYGSLSYMNRHS